MRPAYSVVFLTTLSGAAQGLFLALYLVQLVCAAGALPWPPPLFFALGSALSLALAAMGLVASFFHLGHPERAWRAVAMWRTSWLSRECLFLPAFMAAVFAYGLAHWFGIHATLVLGALGVLLCAGLFVSTGMIYACIKFLQEWASPLTTANFVALGSASGFTLACGLSAFTAPALTRFFAAGAIVLTLAGLALRVASLMRNAGLVHRSTLQSATGITQTRISQKSRGFTGGSFNTREFFHGQTEARMRTVKWAFLLLAFAVPVLLVAGAIMAGSPALAVVAFLVQYLGLLAERWFFFAEANHPQNLYYTGVS